MKSGLRANIRCGRALRRGARFYFVHSYYVCPQQESDTAAHTEYGVRFAAAVARDNLFALQCHPEKSAADGLRLLENFLRWKP